jgi:hypothetical protein
VGFIPAGAVRPALESYGRWMKCLDDYRAYGCGIDICEPMLPENSPNADKEGCEVVGAAGLEPATLSFEG